MDVQFDIRPWGTGFWRWDCRRCVRGARGSFGVLGTPWERSDVVREAHAHLASRHDVVQAPAA